MKAFIEEWKLLMSGNVYDNVIEPDMRPILFRSLGGAILLLAGMMAVVYLLVLKDRRAEHKLSRSEVQAPPQSLGNGNVIHRPSRRRPI